MSHWGKSSLYSKMKASILGTWRLTWSHGQEWLPERGSRASSGLHTLVVVAPPFWRWPGQQSTEQVYGIAESWGGAELTPDTLVSSCPFSAWPWEASAPLACEYQVLLLWAHSSSHPLSQLSEPRAPPSWTMSTSCPQASDWPLLASSILSDMPLHLTLAYKHSLLQEGDGLPTFPIPDACLPWAPALEHTSQMGSRGLRQWRRLEAALVLDHWRWASDSHIWDAQLNVQPCWSMPSPVRGGGGEMTQKTHRASPAQGPWDGLERSERCLWYFFMILKITHIWSVFEKQSKANWRK